MSSTTECLAGTKDPTRKSAVCADRGPREPEHPNEHDRHEPSWGAGATDAARTADRQAGEVARRPSQAEAEAAVRTLLAWAGDDPTREGLLETPSRVVRSYAQFFAGYGQDPEDILAKTFEEIEGYDEMVTVRDIRLESHCEHHMVPFLGKAHVAYLPDRRVVGLSKIARLVEV